MYSIIMASIVNAVERYTSINKWILELGVCNNVTEQTLQEPICGFSDIENMCNAKWNVKQQILTFSRDGWSNWDDLLLPPVTVLLSIEF